MNRNKYINNWRWFVVGTLFLATFLCYFDRQILGTAIDPIAEEFELNNIQIGKLLSAFLISYALGHLLFGFIIDRIRNIRVFYSVMVIGWSITTLLVVIVTDYTTLIRLRYLLGIWESINFPICLMIISRIFPAKERSLAVGIFASGAFFATLVAPPVVVYISNTYNWRFAFGLGGSFSLLWIIPWLLIFRNPEKKVEKWKDYFPNKPEERGFILIVKDLLKSYYEVLRAPGFWGVVLIGIGVTPSLYFATQWLPRFLTQVLHVSYNSSLSVKLTIIYLMQDVGLWIGGLLVLILAKKGLSILKSRKIVMLIGFIAIITILFVPYIQSVTFCVIIFCLTVFGIGVFLGNQHAFKQDVVKGKVAAVASLDGFIEMVFTWQFIKSIGVMTDLTGDFKIVFFIMAALAVFAIVSVFIFIRPKWIVIE